MDGIRRQWPIVAIDGPAGAGKSTVATKVALALGYHLLDTGAIYRCVALCALRANVVDDAAQVTRIAGELGSTKAIRFEEESGRCRVFLNDEDVSAAIRAPEVGMIASITSSLPDVRSALLAIQRQFGELGRVVVEGRDIGSVVFPQAEAKFFLTASTRARAERRHSELASRGTEMPLHAVENEVIERDRRDSTRPVAPLIQAPDAIIVDSTHQGVEDVVQQIVSKVRSIEARLQSAK